MAKNRALKQKNVEHLDDLQRAHPGDLSEEDRVEMEKLQKIREKYGQR